MTRITKVSEKAKLLTFPRAVKVVVESACQKITSLRSVVLNEGLEVIEKYAFYDTGLRSVVLPGSLREISQGAFSKCARLRHAVLRKGIEVLGTDEYNNDNFTYEGVFQDSALTSVQLPSTLKKIEYRTFENCKNLARINLPE